MTQWLGFFLELSPVLKAASSGWLPECPSPGTAEGFALGAVRLSGTAGFPRVWKWGVGWDEEQIPFLRS